MVLEMAEEALAKDGDTREQIKRAALLLFARSGIGSVSVRDIVREAGQKNTGSVHYYFSSKEALVRELGLDIAAIIDAHRHARIDAIEAAGGPHAIREILEVLTLLPDDEPGNTGFDETMSVFVDMMMARHPDLIFADIHVELGLATRRCLAHLRHMLPRLPPPLLEQRFRFAILYAFSILSSRRLALARPELWPARWNDPVAHQNLLDTLEGLLCQPATEQTLNLLDGPGEAPRRPR